MRLNFLDRSPVVDRTAWVSPTALLVGAVVLEKDVGIWFNAVLRADNERIFVGPETNIQDGCVVHNDCGYPVEIARNVTVGHGTIIHGAIIAQQTLIGMGCVILNGCRIGTRCIIGAGALLPEGTIIPDDSIVIGRPGRVVRATTAEEADNILRNSISYVEKKKIYAKQEAIT